MANALINTNMLIWARRRAGFSVPELAKKFGVTEEKLYQWETGEGTMTFNQAMKFAQKTFIPFGYLFLSKAPVDQLPIPDLRTVDGMTAQEPSIELIDLVELMQQRQEWYKEYLQTNLAEPNPFVSSFSVNASVTDVVRSMQTALDISAQPRAGKWDDYYRSLVNKIESIGVMVMRQSYLGHYTRPLNVDEFRGFAIVDNYAPLIFVNHADALGARLFTLIHELCHIWIGQSGVSDANAKTGRKEEVLCNAVAAEFLVPAAEFKKLWIPDQKNWKESLSALEANFHVSTWTLARRALSLGFISPDEYEGYIAEKKDAFKSKKSDKGPTYYTTKKTQISISFARAVVSEAASGQLLMRDAGQLLGGMKPSKIAAFSEELYK